MLQLYSRLFSDQKAAKLKSLDMINNFEEICALEEPLRKLYRQYFKDEEGLRDQAQLKRISEKQLFQLLKDSDLYPGLLSKISVTNLYSYTLEHW